MDQDDDDNDELIGKWFGADWIWFKLIEKLSDSFPDVRPIVSFDEGSNMVATLGPNDSMVELNQQLINSMTSGKSQAPSGTLGDFQDDQVFG